MHFVVLQQTTIKTAGNRAHVKARGVPLLTWSLESGRSPKPKTGRRGVHRRPNRVELSLLFLVENVVSGTRV